MREPIRIFSGALSRAAHALAPHAVGSGASDRGKLAFHIVAALAIALAVGQRTACAQSLEEQELAQQGLELLPSTGNWNATLGAGVGDTPLYPGASADRARPVTQRAAEP